MKIRTFVLRVLIPGLLILPTLRGQSHTTEQAKFRVEISATTDGGPKFTITNLSAKTLTACTFQFSVSSESKPQGEMDWDPLVQGQGEPGRERPGPLEPGASLTMYLPHRVGVPLPDKAEVVAGIWDDGETFGQALWLKTLLDNRVTVTSAYEQAISLLQKGLDENWTRNQYLAALNSKPTSLPIYSIRRTLEANPKLDQDIRSLQIAVQGLLAHFNQEVAPLRQANPPRRAPSTPSPFPKTSANVSIRPDAGNLANKGTLSHFAGNVVTRDFRGKRSSEGI